MSASGAVSNVNGGFIQQIVTDAFAARAFRADFALQNAGGVRIDIPAGAITIADAYELLPFANTLVELEQKGQVSGSRFSSIEVKDKATGTWSPLDANATYIVATNSFIASGRDGYDAFGVAFDEGRSSTPSSTTPRVSSTGWSRTPAVWCRCRRRRTSPPRRLPRPRSRHQPRPARTTRAARPAGVWSGPGR